MYLMHFFANIIFAVTIILVCVTLFDSIAWAAFAGSFGALRIQALWEQYEWWSNIQQISASIAEMNLRIQHASFTTVAGSFGILLVLLVFFIVEYRYRT